MYLLYQNKKSILFLVLILLFSIHAKATFTISGTVITQTGTDANLSGLTAGMGITITTIGTAPNQFIIYTFPPLRSLVINGTLTIDPEKEMLNTNSVASPSITINGTLNAGIEKNINSNTYYTRGTAMVITDNSADWTFDNILVNSGGTLNLYGSTIRLSGRIFVNTGATLRARQAQIVASNFTDDNRIRMQNGNLDIDGLELIGYWLNLATAPTQAKGIKIINESGPEFNYQSTAGGYFIRFDDYDTRYTTPGFYAQKDVISFDGAYIKLYNLVNGSNISFFAGGTGNGNAEAIKQLQIKTQQPNGTAIANTRLLIKDTNNGNRANVQPKGYASAIDYISDRIYIATSAANGFFPIQDILTDVMSGSDTHDRRSKNNNTNDEFDVHLWNYNYLYDASTLQLKGAGVMTLTAPLNADINVTTASEAAAGAIAGIAINHTAGAEKITITGNISLCDLYDYIKYDKVNNNLQKPTISTTAVTANGKTLELGTYQLVLGVGSKLTPCDKFEKIKSNEISNINSPSTNLEVALTDPNGAYKLIRLQNIINGDLTIKDNNTNTILRQATNYTGDINLVVQSTSNSVGVIVTRIGYTNWGTTLDLSAADVFSYIVVQTANFGNPATLANQEAELYLLRKILQKNEAIQAALNNTSFPSINLTTISQPTAVNATAEKQDEALDLLRRILSKTTAIRQK